MLCRHHELGGRQELQLGLGSGLDVPELEGGPQDSTGSTYVATVVAGGLTRAREALLRAGMVDFSTFAPISPRPRVIARGQPPLRPAPPLGASWAGPAVLGGHGGGSGVKNVVEISKVTSPAL